MKLFCKLCWNTNIIKIHSFKPYEDIDWTFDIFECKKCNTRFVFRDKDINYYEILFWKYQDTLYKSQYNLSNMVSLHLRSWNPQECLWLFKKIPIYMEIIDSIKEKPIENTKILEIWSWLWYLAAYIKSIWYNIKGIDISSVAVKYANNTFWNIFSTDLDPKEKYDIIFFKWVISCVDNPKEFLEKYLKLLNNSWYIIFNASNIESVKYTNDIWVSTPPPDVIYLFSKISFKFMVNGNKYELNIREINSMLSIFLNNIAIFRNKKIHNFPVSLKLYWNRAPWKYNKLRKLKVLIFGSLINVFTKCFLILWIFKNISDDYWFLVKINKIKTKNHN